MRLRRLALLAALACTSVARADTAFDIVASYPHDRNAFTEGLFLKDGLLYESTGLNGKSEIRAVRIKDGQVQRRITLDSQYFGEGIAPWKDRIVSLTWRTGQGFVWRAGDFKQISSFRYGGEGWGLTTDGQRLIMSDGTARLRFLDPETLAETGSLEVTWDGHAVSQLNELEYVDGEILANVWYSASIARIDPATGRIKDWINLTKLLHDNGQGNPDAVLNGIAWDPKAKLLYVTGKYWPRLYALRFTK